MDNMIIKYTRWKPRAIKRLERIINILDIAMDKFSDDAYVLYDKSEYINLLLDGLKSTCYFKVTSSNYLEIIQRKFVVQNEIKEILTYLTNKIKEKTNGARVQLQA